MKPPVTPLIATKDATDRELVAAWNVLMFQTRMINGSIDQMWGRVVEVRAELDRRGIPTELGERIKLVH